MGLYMRCMSNEEEYGVLVSGNFKLDKYMQRGCASW